MRSIPLYGDEVWQSHSPNKSPTTEHGRRSSGTTHRSKDRSSSGSSSKKKRKRRKEWVVVVVKSSRWRRRGKSKLPIYCCLLPYHSKHHRMGERTAVGHTGIIHDIEGDEPCQGLKGSYY